MNLPEKFCIVPFKNIVIDSDGGLSPCCEYMAKNETGTEQIVQWWNTGLTTIRDNMLSGVINEGCRHCIAKEENPAYTSYRLSSNKHHQIDIVQTVTDYKQGKKIFPESIEFRASNYCNLKCLMCGEYASSAINQEYQTYKEKYNKIGVFMDNQKTVMWWNKENIIEILKSLLGKVTHINLAGGEPLLVNKLFRLINELEIDSPIKQISLNTSLYTKNSKMIQLLTQLKKSLIYISLEGIGQHNDYIRFGSEWEIIKQNMEYLIKHKCKIMLCHVLQHTSIFSLPALIEFSQQNLLNLLISEVYHGSYPSPGVLTINSAHPADVDKFKLWLSTYTGTHKAYLSNWVARYTYDETLNKKFHDYVTMLDDIRGTEFKKTFNPTYSQQVTSHTIENI